MKIREVTAREIYDLIDLCNERINRGSINSFECYEEGVKAALNWVLGEGAFPLEQEEGDYYDCEFEENF